MKAIQKYIRTSPRKLRLVADAVRSLEPTDALIKLRFLDKRAATPLLKVVKQALANAKNARGLKPEEVRFKHIDISEGPTYKRWRAVSRGSAHGIFKRSSHIKIELEEANGSKS